MDALLIALLGCLVAEMGGKSQMLVAAQAHRFGRNAPVVLGLIVATIANCAIAALMGRYLAPMLSPEARLLFLAMALLFLGVGLLWPVKPPDLLRGWRIGPFPTTLLGLFILAFGDGAQFLILGLAVRMADPLLAALGGTIGIVVALMPAVLLRDRLFTLLPMRVIRLGGGALMILAGLGTGLSALGRL